MPVKTVVVALDLNKDHADFHSYDSLGAPLKIARIRNRIKAICISLAKTHPDSMWIFCWRENAIMQDSRHRFIWDELNNRFKSSMTELTQCYPNLKIIAGTIPVRKRFPNASYLARVKRTYELHNWVAFREFQAFAYKETGELKSESEAKDFLQFKSHKQQAAKLEENFSEPVDVVSNRCYVFDKSKVQFYAKSAPFCELDCIATDDRYIVKSSNQMFFPKKRIAFELATSRNSYPIFKFKHNESKITAAVEICREHCFGFLSKMPLDDKPDIHFILSDSFYINPRFVRGRYVIFVDSLEPIDFQMTEKIPEDKRDVVLFKNNLLEETNKLVEIKPSFLDVKNSKMQEKKPELDLGEVPELQFEDADFDYSPSL